MSRPASLIARVGGLGLGVGLGEDRDGRDAEIARLLGGLDEEIDGKAVDTGHGGDRGAGILALLHEHRPDQVVGRQFVLSHEPARPVFAAVAPQPGGGVTAQGRKAFRHARLMA